MGSKWVKNIQTININSQVGQNNVKSVDNESYVKERSDSHKNSEVNTKSVNSTEMTSSSDTQNMEMQVPTITSCPNKNRKNSKKSKVAIDNLTSTEIQALKIVKKHNRECDDAKMIESCLMKHFFMRCLDRQARAEIVKEMSLCFVPTGVVLFQQGMTGSFFYILKEGKLELIINEKVIKTIEPGENFGEFALLHGAPRSGTVKSVADCFLWVMERKNFRKIVEHITRINFEENKKFIQTIPILNNIEHDQKALLCSNLYKEVFEEGHYIVKEGEQASCLFIVKEGEVNCISNGEIVRTLKKGDYFGERAILIDSTRTMDVIAKTKCVCYSISAATLQSMIGDQFRSLLYLNFIKSSFSTSQYLNKFSLRLIDSVFEYFRAINLGKDDIVYPAGYVMSSKIVVIIDGQLINSNSKEVVAKRGTILFEKELASNSSDVTDYDLVAFPDCLLIEAETEIISKLLGGSLNDLMGKSSVIATLQKVHIFRNLTHKKLEILSEKIGVAKYENGKNIIMQGEEGSKLFIVKSGKVDILVGTSYIRTLNENEYFGERALFFKEPRSASAVANGPVEVFYLEQEDFISNIENNMQDHLMNRLFLQDNSVQLKDLDYHQQLGSGNYGQVCLVQSKKSKFFYAIKGISKKQIDYEQLHKNLELERSILLQIDHPFIVKLVKTLKDSKYIYFLMEYIKGKELFDVIRDIGLLSKYQTQFYGASMMLAVDYLHERKFIYRDIKPENIIVIESGYIKLIDFGTAKAIQDRTSTILGTPHYMAPEVILGEGYSFQVDYWSIAICMYEFLCGGVPFGDSAEDPMEIYLAIVHNQLTFPPFCKDKDFKHFITSMLSKNPLTRLGKLPQIKNQIWFHNFNWDNLISLNSEPAHIPKLSQEDSKKTLIPYTQHVENNFKEWEPPKDMVLDNKMKSEFDKWFQEF